MNLLKCLFILFLFSGSLAAQDFVVNSTGDVIDANPGDGVCSTGNIVGNPGVPECTLRAAINEANASPGTHKITLPAGVYSLSIAQYCPAGDNGSHYHYCVLGKINIVGAGASNTILDVGGKDRVILVGGSGQLQLSGVTVENGNATNSYDAVGGGGISNLGTLTVSNSIFTGNQTTIYGGAIYTEGPLQVTGTMFSANNAAQYGGAIYSFGSSSTQIDNSTFENNSAGEGGGIYLFASQTTISNCTFTRNSANYALGSGGAIDADEANDGLNRRVKIVNSTIAGNQSNFRGGGAAFHGYMGADFNNVTVTGNSPSGIADTGAQVTLQNTIVALNPTLSSTDCDTNPNISNLVSSGHNLIGNPANCNFSGDNATNITGKDPLVGILSNNGGLTQTIALGSNSPAIDAGSPLAPGSGGTSCAQLDQRGYVRPIGGACDIGAFETGRGLSLLTITPAHAANAAPLVSLITGTDIPVGCTIKLSRVGQTDIFGTSPTIDPTGTALSAVFDITGAAAGQWDVVLTTPDNRIATLSGGFTVSSASAAQPKVWSHLIGRSAVRPGYIARYALVYGNSGDVDAFAVPLTITTPAAYQLYIYSPISAPPAQTGQVISDWTFAPVQTALGTANVNANLLIPVVPAGFQGSIEFGLFVPSTAVHGTTFQLFAATGNPFFNPTLDPSVTSQMVAGAQDYAFNLTGLAAPASASAIQAYVTNQLGLLVSNGRAFLVGSLGIQPQYYSLSQLLIDAGNFAATPPVIAASPLRAFAAGSAPGTGGGILAPGASGGGIEPDPLPVPDEHHPFPPPDKPITPGQCRDLPNHTVSADGTWCLPKPHSNCAIVQNPLFSDPNCARFPLVDAVDPNDKSGPIGATSQNFILQNTGLGYTIYFENLATATAPAQQVVVTDQLDLTNLDPASFSFGKSYFTGYFLTPPPHQNHFVGAVDLRPHENIIVKVEGTFNPASGLITWVFTSLDPITEQLTTDPTAGFLPPNVTSPNGEGRVTFDILPKAGVASGGSTCNQATVVFDKNPAILTPTWCNGYDNTPPVSKVQALPGLETSTTFGVSWSGTDIGSGIAAYNIFVSDNGAAYSLWQSGTTATSAQFTGQVGHTYGFVSQAVDNAGNLEALRGAADTATTIGTTSVAPAITLQPLSQTSTAGSSVTFIATASGSPTPTVQWQLSSDGGVTYNNLSGATSSKLSFVALVGQSGNFYRAVFTNTAGTATTSAARLTVNPLAGDLNGDGVVNCADIAIVKASFGKKVGQPGFDPRADVNHDGVVNVLDLSYVAKRLPTGMICQ